MCQAPCREDGICTTTLFKCIEWSAKLCAGTNLRNSKLSVYNLREILRFHNILDCGTKDELVIRIAMLKSWRAYPAFHKELEVMVNLVTAVTSLIAAQKSCTWQIHEYCIKGGRFQLLQEVRLAHKGLETVPPYQPGRKLHFWLSPKKLYIHTYLIDHSPLGLFRANETNNWNNRLRIPTGRRQTSWLCTSAAEELNLERIQLVISAGLELGIARLQIRRPNHSATLPLDNLDEVLEPLKVEISLYEERVRSKINDSGTTPRSEDGNQMKAMRLVGTRVMAHWSKSEIGQTGWRTGKIFAIQSSM